MSKEEHYEERKRLYNQFKTDCPQTIGETDKAFDNDNFIDWLVDNQNTKPLIEKISSLEASLLDVTRKSCARVDELKDEIADLKSQLLISEQKVKLNYNCAIESSKSEANEAVESQEDILRELISLIQTSSSVGIIMQKFTITRNNK